LRIAIAGIHALVTGGAESYLKALIPLLEAQGHEVTYGYQLQGGPGPPVARTEIAVDLGRFAARAILDLSPDVVLQNSLVSPLEELRLVRSGMPVAFFAHAYSGLCISGTRRFSRPAPEVCTRRFGAGCWTKYFNRGCGGNSPLTAARLFRENRIRLEAMQGASAVIVASDHMRELVLAHGIPRDRVFKVPLFVRDAVPDTWPRQRLEMKRLSFIGRITPLKGWRELLEAFRLFLRDNPRWTLRVVGEGSDLGALRSRAGELGLPVTFHPWQDQAGLDALLDSSSLLVLPSTWPEPFGVVGLEAARLGIPTVTFGTGGIREWLTSGVNGEMAARLDARSLADALTRAISSAAHYEELARGALDAAGRHGSTRHLTALLAILESLPTTSRPRADQAAPA